jgi:hypothetical protein
VAVSPQKSSSSHSSRRAMRHAGKRSSGPASTSGIMDQEAYRNMVGGAAPVGAFHEAMQATSTSSPFTEPAAANGMGYTQVRKMCVGYAQMETSRLTPTVHGHPKLFTSQFRHTVAVPLGTC